VNGVAQNDREVLAAVGNITSIKSDATGEMYVVTHNGVVRRITAAP
jgi:ligand-binding sensor domain-containing protein